MSKYCFGIDVGGTTVKMGFFTEDGDLIEKWEIPTVTVNNGSQILPDIAKAVKGKIAEKEIKDEDVIGIGIGVPGPVDNKGVIYKAVNLGWDEFNLEKELSDLTGLKVKAGNDANVAALGEMWKGGGMGYSDIVLVTLGTGVGGGIIVDGKILTGSKGAGGEIGHIHVEDNEDSICGCGNKGCIEQFASATGITRLANRKLNSCDTPSILRGGEISAKTVFDAVKENDALAIEIAEEFGKYLGKGLAAVGCVMNPQAFVIGGGVSKAGDVLLDYIKKNYAPYVFHASREADFVLAKLGNDAGIYGSAKLLLI